MHICLAIIFALIILPMASANMKAYDSDANKITISKSVDILGLKLKIPSVLGGGDIATYTLISNTDRCIYNCSASGTAELYKDGVLFKNINFKNLDDGKSTSIIKSQFYIKTAEVWIEYNGEILKAGNYEWKLEGVKAFEQSVDWIATIQNDITLDEWAEWTVANCTATGGTIALVDGISCVHTFTTNGTFNVSSAGNLDVSILVVAGGGAGGSGTVGNDGGGGAGGYIYNSSFNATASSNTTVIVGNGGFLTAGAIGKTGMNSSFGTTVAWGGGGGGIYQGKGATGGSGGGNGQTSGAVPALGKSPQGNDGGLSINFVSGAGGGGAATSGGNASTNPTPGSGGNGTLNDINGTSMYYAGGGGGGTHNSGAGIVALGGLGGGGNGKDGDNNPQAQNATNGTGGGGGGGGENQNGGNGGKGIVIISYELGGAAGANSAPANNSVNNALYVTFNGTCRSVVNISNATLYVYNSTGLVNSMINTTVNTPPSSNYSFNYTDFGRLGPDNYTWDINCTNKDSESGISLNFTFIHYGGVFGKVVDSIGAAINSATVIILNSTKIALTNLTTNSTGDWFYISPQTISNFTAVGFNPSNISQGGAAYPFIST